MPIVNKHPISFRREIQCKSCGNFLAYNRSETVYVCTYCGRQYDPRMILSEIRDTKSSSSPKQKVLTKKQKLKNEWKDVLDFFESNGE